jgi:hypothetical protein
LTLIAGAGLLMAARSAWSHHAFEAEFDANKPVKLQGRVTQVEWINPHVWIHLDVKDRDGKVANFRVEGGPQNAILRRGFTKKILPEGAEIVVDGYQSKDRALRAKGRYFRRRKEVVRRLLGPGRIEPTASEITISYLVSCFRRR